MDFNPRSREGSDAELEKHADWVDISIHAPARGATRHMAEQTIYFSISIHAPARGATSVVDAFGVLTGEFQSTLPRGERLRMIASV